MAPLWPIGPARDPSQYSTDFIMFFNRRGFAAGTPWPAAEFSGVRAYIPFITSWPDSSAHEGQVSFLKVDCIGYHWNLKLSMLRYSDRNLLDLIERNLIASSVIKPRRPRRRLSSTLLNP